MYLCAKMIVHVFSCFACMCVIPKHTKCPMLERPQTCTLQNVRTERRLGDLPHVIVHVRTWRPACVCVHTCVCVRAGAGTRGEGSLAVSPCQPGVVQSHDSPLSLQGPFPEGKVRWSAARAQPCPPAWRATCI